MFAKNLRKVVNKYASDTIAEGFFESDAWVSSGNYALNKLLSGSYFKAFPFHKTVLIAGESGSGKSLVAATAAANAQQNHNAVVIWLDAEKASKRDWLEGLGIDTAEDKFVYIEVATIGDVKKIVSGVVKELKATDEAKRENVFLVIDSYSLLLTESQMEQATSGELKGDQGQKAKQLKDLVSAITHLIARVPVCCVGMVHTMASQDQYNPDEILTGGRGLQYAASQVIAFTKAKLKGKDLEDGEIIDEYNDKTIAGIRCISKVYKSRFAKPNERVVVQIPYPHGVDPFSGLFDQMMDRGIITSPSVGWYSYVFSNGQEAKFRKKDFRQHAEAIMIQEEDLDPVGEIDDGAGESA